MLRPGKSAAQSVSLAFLALAAGLTGCGGGTSNSGDVIVVPGQ